MDQQEWLATVFGCLFAENWFQGQDVSEAGLCVRNLAFPRDSTSWANRPGLPPCGLSNHNNDHFDDRDLDGVIISKSEMCTLSETVGRADLLI